MGEALVGLLVSLAQAVAARLSWPGGAKHPHAPADRAEAVAGGES